MMSTIQNVRVSQSFLFNLLSKAVTVLIVGLASIVFVQNISLLKEVRAWRLKSSVTNLQPNRHITDISGVDADGHLRRQVFPLSNKKYVVVITLSTKCKACEDNQNHYNLLAKKV